MAPPDPVDTFAANLLRLRDERGMTQEGLALEAGMQMHEISDLERAQREPGIRVLCRIAEALGVEPGDLLAP